MVGHAHAYHNVGKTERQHTEQTRIRARQTYYFTEYSAQKDEAVKCTKNKQQRHYHRRKITSGKHHQPLVELVGQVHEES